MAMSQADYHWLLGPEGRGWLDQVTASDEPDDRWIGRLRQQLTPEQAHLVLQQRTLRQRARRKFPQAAAMFFTPRGLEQATDARIAAYKVSRFAPDAPVVDLCCGIGGDLVALAQRGPVTGIDADAQMTLLAAANAAACQVHATVRCQDATEVLVPQFAAWHIDPDRRADGRRHSRPEQYQPTVEQITRLLHQNPNAAIKLAPAAEPPLAWQEQSQCEWIGHHRECQQLVCWFGSLAHQPGQCTATTLHPEGHISSITGQPDMPLALTTTVQRFVLEPQASILAARLAGELAARYRLHSLTPGGGYLTGDRPIEVSFASTFEVQHVLPFRPKKLAGLLRQEKVGSVEIKKRGVSIDPAQLQRQLRGTGEHHAVVLLTRIGRSVMAIVARRLARPD